MVSPTERVVRRARKRGVTILTRKQWGTQHEALYQERRRLTREGVWGEFAFKADTLVQHITVTFDTGVLRGNFIDDMQTVERIGFDRFKSGFSYNFGVDPITGMAGVGMPLDAKGTHTINDKNMPGFSKDQNLKARAIAIVGMPGVKVSDDCVWTISQLAISMVIEDQLTPGHDYLPHSFFTEKDCPTQNMRDRMPEIERRVHRALRRRELL